MKIRVLYFLTGKKRGKKEEENFAAQKERKNDAKKEKERKVQSKGKRQPTTTKGPQAFKGGFPNYWRGGGDYQGASGGVKNSTYTYGGTGPANPRRKDQGNYLYFTGGEKGGEDCKLGANPPPPPPLGGQEGRMVNGPRKGKAPSTKNNRKKNTSTEEREKTVRSNLILFCRPKNRKSQNGKKKRKFDT